VKSKNEAPLFVKSADNLGSYAKRVGGEPCVMFVTWPEKARVGNGNRIPKYV
jgi:hypothetical protein